MNLLKILEEEALLQLRPFTPKTSLSADTLAIELTHPDLNWKEEKLDLKNLPVNFDGLATTSGQKITVALSDAQDSASLSLFQNLLTDIRELLLKENLHLDFWKTISHPFPDGFSEGTLENTSSYLKKLYANRKVVEEKKAFLVDLNKSFGPYLVADETHHPAINDAASQIASLALGHNHRVRSVMPIRPEVLDQDLDLSTWDIAKSFRRIVKEQSDLPHVYFCNSGAEAMEVAIQSCQSQYPTRRKIVAFEGSFHGRTLLALHATYNPAKRLPFQIYNDLVDFVSFPEDKTPSIEKSEPKDWLELWAKANDASFEAELSKLRDPKDPLLESEIESLLQIRTSILKEAPLCVVAEPMQCEGGDRYGTNRYFRALRKLTRSLDCALVMDEVQTGFGLGKSFFWHRDFDLNETPDALYQAKKSQTAFCATRFELLDFREEACPASIYRGYIQAVEILEQNSDLLMNRVSIFLELFQNFVGKEIVSHPRNQGYAFAFDMPSTEVLTAFVKARFKYGLLFYPAGEKTARFRLLLDTSDIELFEIFRGLILCLKDLEADGTISSKIPSIDKWDDQFKDLFAKWNTHPKKQKLASIWPENLDSTPAHQWEASLANHWDECFGILLTRSPQLIYDLAKSPYKPKNPPKSFDEILSSYKKEPRFTKLDMLLRCSRFLGTRVIRADKSTIKKFSQQIDDLERDSYEEARQTLSDVFLKNIEHTNSIVHLAIRGEGQLMGICASAPAKNFQDVPMLCDDGYCETDKNLYAYDLTVAESARGAGLGYRLKAEQLVSAIAQGSTQIKSRNRYPESINMAKLNYKLGHGAILKAHKQYDGNATALYQSFAFQKRDTLRVGDVREASLKNKLTLSNFVTAEYCHNIEILSEYYPENLRHFYLSSGRAEASDKMIRLLRNARSTGIEAISLKDSYFGQTTAVARSLGGPHPNKYFAWPVFEKAKELEQYLSTNSPELVLGVFASFTKSNAKKIEPELQEFSRVCLEHKIPFISGSDELPMPGLRVNAHLCYGKGQLGIVAVDDELFFDKPLQMISTWDGDEWSLARFKDSLLRRPHEKH